MKFEDYLLEMNKFSKAQRCDLQHFIVNMLSNVETARLIKKAKGDADEITISKQDAKIIIKNLEKIRKFIINLPHEEDE